MKMFWNDPWETQPEDSVKKTTTSQIADTKADKTTGIDLATCEPGCPADEGLNGYLPMPE